MQVRFRWLVEDVDRYGNIRIYVRCSIRRRKRGVGGRSTLWPKSMLINRWH